MPELRVVVTIVALLGAMGIAVGVGARRRSGPAMLLLLAFVWLTLDRFFEGQLLISFTPSNGFTSSDLVAVVAIGIAGWQLVRLRHRPVEEPVSLVCPRCGTAVGALVAVSTRAGPQLVRRQLCPNELDTAPAPHGPVPNVQFLLTRAT